MNNDKQISCPLVHLNGTSKQSLEDQFLNVKNKADELMQALGEASPNGRDYYPLGSEVFTQARKEHIERLKSTQSIIDDMIAIVLHLNKDD